MLKRFNSSIELEAAGEISNDSALPSAIAEGMIRSKFLQQFFLNRCGAFFLIVFTF
jgi:hypothetical protein